MVAFYIFYIFGGGFFLNILLHIDIDIDIQNNSIMKTIQYYLYDRTGHTTGQRQYKVDCVVGIGHQVQVTVRIL